MQTAKRLTVRGLVFFGSLSIFLTLLHSTDDILRGEPTRGSGQLVSEGAFALIVIVVLVIYVFGVGWTWMERRYGYAVLLVVSAFSFQGDFLGHAFGVEGGPDSLTRIGSFYTLPSMGAFFVFISLAAGLTTLTTIVLAIYILAVKKKT